jgi:hypothetical protein
VWFFLVITLGVVVFKILTFTHFWQAWEFLAATTATLYNLFFAVIVYTSHKQDGEGTLKNALPDGSASTMHIILRVCFPSLFFALTAFVVFLDRHSGPGPVEANMVFWKLGLTLAAFITVCIGDYATSFYLREIADTRGRMLQAWIAYFRTRVWLIDAPFVIGYAGLIVIYALYRIDGAGTPLSDDFALLLQAFVGGASALEMMTQSAIHGFSEYANG